MRKLLMTMTMLTVSAGGPPAYALQANDTMKAWRNASSKERSELLEQLLGKHASGDAESAKTLKCLNETSMIPGHVDLQIQEVAQACSAAGNAGQPV